jgi:Arc/MetJ family transcription regulator
VRRVTLRLDGEKLARVQRELGTRGPQQTVDRALDEILALAARRKLLERLKTMKGLDLNKRSVMAGAWR